ncbi:hypothetical protein [Mucilaginibacter kameinonensis]|uniref:hypothetical protein n=1 Tax=Mucilaginibacter kameinonensis TaxID=452286 RepID=UPI000EF75E54|nr:hypothetical protein [Mucilaginibacter kameinonensis]
MATNTNNGAEQVILDISVNGTDQVKEATQEVGKLGSKVGEVSKQPVGNLDGFKNYKQLIRDATSELQKIEQQQGKNSAAFLQGAKDLAELKRRASEFKDTLNSFSPENKFAAFSKVASGAAGSLAGFSGGLIALGFNSEKSSENLARLQGLLAFSHALSNLDDLKKGFSDLGRVIAAQFLPKQAYTKATQEQTVANEELVTSNEALVAAQTERAAAETALATAIENANNLKAESEAALAEARAAGLDAETELSGAEEAYLELAALAATAKQEQIALQEAYNAALAQEAELTAANTAAQGALAATITVETVATGGATVATTAFGTALKAIGIGLVIALIATLVTQWDNLKAGISGLFPTVKASTDTFHSFMEVVNGVGLVILKGLKVPIDYVITSIKVLIDVIKLDFKAAANDLKDGIKNVADDLNVVANYQKGAANKRAAYAEEARKEETQKTIEQNDRQLKLLKAQGKDATALQIENEKLKLSVLDKSDKDYQKKYADGQNQIAVIQAEADKKIQDKKDKDAKAAAEKAAAALKTDLDAIKKQNEDALKVIAEGTQDARDKELTDLDVKYKKEFDLLEKRKKDLKDYNTEFNNLTEARKNEELRVNKKYDDQIAEYLKSIENENLSTYDKAIQEINKKIDEQLKNATPEQKELLEASRNDQINNQRLQKIGNSVSNHADAKDVQVNRNNKAKDTDTADVAKNKVNANEKADTDKENAEFQAKLLGLKGQNDAIELLTQQHETALTNIADNAAEARKKIDENAFEAKKEIQSAEADLLGGFGSLLEDIGEKNKAIAIAGIVAEQAAGIGKIVINTQVANAKAVAASPITFGQPWVTINTISGVLAGAASIAAGAKAISQLKSGTASGVDSPSSISNGGTPSAPIINSTVLQQNGSQDIVKAVQTEKSKPVEAYVVLKSLKNAEAKDSLNNSLSSY